MNEKESLRDTVRKGIARQLERSEQDIYDDLPIMEGLGADSLDVVELLTALEDRFGIVVPDDAVLQLRTVEDVLTFLAANGVRDSV